MPLLQKSIQMIGKTLPKPISPRVHAVVDYATVSLFILGAILFWRRNKRAAVASLVCGVAEAAVASVTDYSGGMRRVISMPLHRKIDFGLSSMTATMPQFLAFEDEKEKAFFRIQSAAIAGVAALTNFEPQDISGEQELRAA